MKGKYKKMNIAQRTRTHRGNKTHPFKRRKSGTQEINFRSITSELNKCQMIERHIAISGQRLHIELSERRTCHRPTLTASVLSPTC